MRIATQISTGKLIEMQSHATEGTLTANAFAAGLDPSDIEEREVSPEEFAELLAKLQPPAPRDPTKAELLKQLQALRTQIESL